VEEGITIVVPVRDEQATVGAALESLARQSVGPERLEVLVYDGGSTDGTPAICRSFADRWPWRRFEVIPNARATVPHALNAGLEESRARWFGRVDGRIALSPNYLECCLDVLPAAGPPVAAGGRFEALAEGRVAAGIAAAVTHPLGVGRGFRTRRTAGEIPHHPFALWRTEDVRGLGGFTPGLTRNQDDEFSMRATRAGARILLVPDAVVSYRPRERLAGLAAQYFQYGLWKSAVARRHGLFPLRALAPAVLLVGATAGLGLALTGRTRFPLIALAAAYLAAGTLASRHQAGAHPLATGCSLATTHVSYGAGVLAGAATPTITSTRLGNGRVR
jgi:glycosyltransferase involved in cell wall biosynthesis